MFLVSILVEICLFWVSWRVPFSFFIFLSAGKGNGVGMFTIYLGLLFFLSSVLISRSSFSLMAVQFSYCPGVLCDLIWFLRVVWFLRFSCPLTLFSFMKYTTMFDISCD